MLILVDRKIKKVYLKQGFFLNYKNKYYNKN